jgi:hypothetical protein
MASPVVSLTCTFGILFNFFEVVFTPQDLNFINLNASHKIMTQLKRDYDQHIQYRTQVVNNLEQENYHIDVITENYLEEYLNIIEREINEIVTRLKRKKKELENSIDFFVKKLNQAKDKSEFQNILECK